MRFFLWSGSRSDSSPLDSACCLCVSIPHTFLNYIHAPDVHIFFIFTENSLRLFFCLDQTASHFFKLFLYIICSPSPAAAVHAGAARQAVRRF